MSKNSPILPALSIILRPRTSHPTPTTGRAPSRRIQAARISKARADHDASDSDASDILSNGSDDEASSSVSQKRKRSDSLGNIRREAKKIAMSFHSGDDDEQDDIELGYDHNSELEEEDDEDDEDAAVIVHAPAQPAIVVQNEAVVHAPAQAEAIVHAPAQAEAVVLAPVEAEDEEVCYLDVVFILHLSNRLHSLLR